MNANRENITMIPMDVYTFLYKKLGILGKDCIDAELSAITGHYVIDIFKLEDQLVEKHGYNEDIDGSMGDFVLSKLGKEVCDQLMIIIDQ